MNRDDDSDLTDLESSEEEEEEYTSSQQKKAKKKATTTYNLRNPLKVPRATTYAAQALFGLLFSFVLAYNKCFRNPGKVSPIEFVGISVLIGTLRKKLTMKQLGSAIAALRSGLREVHVDVRMNTRVSRTVLDLIRGMKPSQFAQDTGPVAAKHKAGGGKRKRVMESDDEDEVDVDGGEDAIY
ncbi:hypothetical protein BKA70DRAFT_1570655 [Coprinopsis sp. MPI-PUGE-AT-0042]|nr:hypothetical protein BKA70DRAFT_1570655 [Coprinopsis sp. MPI-PUGE-AT-0042]